MVDIINNAKREADIADQIVSRTHEQYQYDLNIQNYETLLATLPQDEWPADLAGLKGMPDHEAAFACPPDRVDELSQYLLRDRIGNLIKSEKVERAKVAAILAVIDAQLVGPGRDAALQAAINRRETALNKIS